VRRPGHWPLAVQLSVAEVPTVETTFTFVGGATTCMRNVGSPISAMCTLLNGWPCHPPF